MSQFEINKFRAALGDVLHRKNILNCSDAEVNEVPPGLHRGLRDHEPGRQSRLPVLGRQARPPRSGLRPRPAVSAVAPRLPLRLREGAAAPSRGRDPAVLETGAARRPSPPRRCRPPVGMRRWPTATRNPLYAGPDFTSATPMAI